MGFCTGRSQNHQHAQSCANYSGPLEIRRNSVKEGFTISKRDEESQINVTLLELLKQDFNIDIQGLDPLPLV